MIISLLLAFSLTAVGLTLIIKSIVYALSLD